MKQNTFQQLQRTFGTFNQKRELYVFYFCKCRRHKDVSLTKIKNSALDHIHLNWKGSSFNGNQIHNCFKVESMWEVWYFLTCISRILFFGRRKVVFNFVDITIVSMILRYACPAFLLQNNQGLFLCKFVYDWILVTEYGQKNRHDVEEKDLKEFLRLQKLASEDDEEQTDGNYMLIVCLIRSFHKSRESK